MVVTPCNVAVPGSTNLDLTEMSLSHGCHRQSMSQVSPSFCEGVVDNDLIHRG